MIRSGAGKDAVLEKLMEFERVAGLLDMPEAERLGILNLSQEIYSGLRSGRQIGVHSLKPELERRLSYALPLMRRLASTRVSHTCRPAVPALPHDVATTV